MKLIKFITPIASFFILSVSSNLLAYPYQSNFYAGAQIGVCDLHYDGSDWNHYFNSIDDKGIAGRLFAGLNVNRNLALEAGFTLYQNPEFRWGYSKTDFTQDSFDLLAKVSVPLSCDLSIHGTGGVAFVHRDNLEVVTDNFVIRSGDDADDRVRPVLGAGISYVFNARVTGEVDFQRTFGIDDLEDADFFGVGLSFKLG